MLIDFGVLGTVGFGENGTREILAYSIRIYFLVFGRFFGEIWQEIPWSVPQHNESHS